MVLAVPSMLIGLVGTPFANYFEAFIHPPSETVMEIASKAAEFDRNFNYGWEFGRNCPDWHYLASLDVLEGQN